jgi:hypothetical protein
MGPYRTGIITNFDGIEKKLKEFDRSNKNREDSFSLCLYSYCWIIGALLISTNIGKFLNMAVYTGFLFVGCLVLIASTCAKTNWRKQRRQEMFRLLKGKT